MNRNRFHLMWAVTVAMVLLLTVPVSAQMLFVDDMATGAGTGAAWANAYPILQDALDAAAASGGAITELWVAEGTYYPDDGASVVEGDRSATFQLQSGVALYGGSGGWETNLSQRNFRLNISRLNGDLDDNDSANTVDEPTQSENSYHVVTGNGVSITAILDGFTISGGNASDITPPDDAGGGMRSDSGSPTVRNCVFTVNSAYFGGGMFNENGSSIVLTDCAFQSNRSAYVGGAMSTASRATWLSRDVYSSSTVREMAQVVSATGAILLRL